MESKECPFGERLFLYIDGELEEEESSRMEAHLKECAVCSRDADFLKGFDDAFQTEIPIPSNFTAETMKKIREPLNVRDLSLCLGISALFIGIFFFVHATDPLPVFGGLLTRFILIARNHSPFALLNELLAQNSAILISYMAAIAALVVLWKKKPLPGAEIRR